MSERVYSCNRGYCEAMEWSPPEEEEEEEEKEQEEEEEEQGGPWALQRDEKGYIYNKQGLKVGRAGEEKERGA